MEFIGLKNAPDAVWFQQNMRHFGITQYFLSKNKPDSFLFGVLRV
jgi:hypothetical protein